MFRLSLFVLKAPAVLALRNGGGLIKCLQKAANVRVPSMRFACSSLSTENTIKEIGVVWISSLVASTWGQWSGSWRLLRRQGGRQFFISSAVRVRPWHA